MCETHLVLIQWLCARLLCYLVRFAKGNGVLLRQAAGVPSCMFACFSSWVYRDSLQGQGTVRVCVFLFSFPPSEAAIIVRACSISVHNTPVSCSHLLHSWTSFFFLLLLLHYCMCKWDPASLYCIQ